MICNYFGNQKRYFVRGVKLACLFSGIGSEHTNQIFIYVSKNIVILFAIHWNIFYQINQIADRFGP